MTGEEIFVVAVAVALIARAIWMSAARGRHLAWLPAVSGPVALLGGLLDQDWLFLAGIGLLIVGEFVYQMSDEPSRKDLDDLKADEASKRRRPR